MSLFIWKFTLNNESTKWSIKRSSIVGKQSINHSKSPHHKESAYHKKSAARTNSHNSTNIIGVQKVNTLISKPFPRKVLIISRGRSGSSFLGELFNQNKKTFYLFEPLGWARKNPSLYEEERFKVIDDLLSNKMCLNFLIRKKFFELKPKNCRRFLDNAATYGVLRDTCRIF